MMDIPDGVKSLTICLPVFTVCTNVTDRHTDRHRVAAKAALDASIARKKSHSVYEIYAHMKKVQFFDSQCTSAVHFSIFPY